MSDDVTYHREIVKAAAATLVENSGDGAKQLYLKAAEDGNANAQLVVGGMYENGIGVEQSDSKAKEWYGKAAAQENASAQILSDAVGQPSKLDLLVKEREVDREMGFLPVAETDKMAAYLPPLPTAEK